LFDSDFDGLMSAVCAINLWSGYSVFVGVIAENVYVVKCFIISDVRNKIGFN